MDFGTARQIALKRDRVCQSCGAEDDLHAHHIIPRREDGPDTPENLVILCQHCHPKYEGTQIVPSYAGGGARVRDVVAKLTLDSLVNLTPDFETPDEVFKSIQRDKKICTNCFRRNIFEESNERKIKRALSRVIMSLFQEIRGDPDICSNCFRKKRERFERNYRMEVVQEDGEWIVKPFQVSGIELTKPDGSVEIVKTKPDDVYTRDEDVTSVPGDESSHGMVTVCECGFRWAPEHEVEEWKNRPLAKPKFFATAERLLERVRESGVKVNEDEYLRWLDVAKSDPDRQFADDRMFKRALEYAVQNG